MPWHLSCLVNTQGIPIFGWLIEIKKLLWWKWAMNGNWDSDDRTCVPTTPGPVQWPLDTWCYHFPVSKHSFIKNVKLLAIVITIVLFNWIGNTEDMIQCLPEERSGGTFWLMNYLAEKQDLKSSSPSLSPVLEWNRNQCKKITSKLTLVSDV